MRKHNEGYVLVLVLVVLIVLCLFSTAILTGAQRNLQAQMNSVADMRNKYEAQGEIEEYVVSFLELAENVSEEDEEGILLASYKIDGFEVQVDPDNKKLVLIAEVGEEQRVQVVCTYTLACDIILKDEDETGAFTVKGYKGMTCTSCEISRVEVSDDA